MGGTPGPIYSPLGRKGEEKVDVVQPKNHRSQGKSAKLTVGLICGLALLAGMALISHRIATRDTKKVATESMLVPESDRADLARASFEGYDYKDYDACYDGGCPEEQCEKLVDGSCDGSCQAQLRSCMNTVVTPTPQTFDPNTIDDETLQREVEKLTLKEFEKMPKRELNRIKRSQAAPVTFDTNEKYEKFLIDNCVNRINRLASDFFRPKDNQAGRCPTSFDTNNILSFPRCEAEWISYDQRAIFFEECMKAQNPNNLHRKMVVHSQHLETIRRNVETYARDFSAARASGGAQVIGGSVLMGLGVVIPPLAPVVSPLGMALTFTGTGTSMVATLLGDRWTQDQADIAAQDMKKMSHDYKMFVTLIALYQQAYIDIMLLEGPNKVLKDTEEKVDVAVRQSVPVLALSPKLASYIYKTIQAKIAGKSTATAASGAAVKHTSMRSHRFIGKLKTLETPGPLTKVLSGLAKITRPAGRAVATVGRFTMPIISGAVGIWDVVQGAEVSNVHKGFVHQIQLAVRDLQNCVDDAIWAYQEMNLGQNTTYDYNEIAQISSIDFRLASGGWSDKRLQFEVRSQNSDGRNVSFRTNVISSHIFNDKWVLMKNARDLGQVGTETQIFNDETFWIRFEALGSTVSVDKIQMGVNGRFIPNIECGDGKTAVKAIGGGGKSAWMECKRKLGLKKIKFHTSNADYAGTDDYISIKLKIPTEGGEEVTCETGYLDNAGNDRVRGRTDVYKPSSDPNYGFGTCTDDKFSAALMTAKQDQLIKVTIKKENYMIWSDEWTPDLLKIYFTMEQDEDWIITCELCNSHNQDSPENCNMGHGIELSESRTLSCFTLNPKHKARSLEKIKVKSCDLTDAGSSSDKLRLNICKLDGRNTDRPTDSHARRLAGDVKCCTTNLFGANIARGGWSGNIDGNTATSDGGEQLGQCEGFPIEGSKVEISLKNEGTDAVCFDEFEFYGGKEMGFTSTADIPFIKCNPSCQIWGEGSTPESYCEGQADWHPWKNVKAQCFIPDIDETTVKKIALMTCPGSTSGSSSKIKVVIQNMDGEQCTTDALQNRAIQPGHYVESSNIGRECLRTPIKNGKAKVWIVNEDEADSLCVTDVYLDVSSRTGATRMLKCQLDEDESFKVYAQDMDTSGVPLMCT